jgi:HPt (histidine-containing phosphotransfer) domain-containing protein
MELPEELHHRYLERRKKDFKTCLDSFQDENYPELERVGHQLKGNGITFGHEELTEIGAELEKAAAAANTDELEVAIKKFSAWLKDNLN